MREFAQALLLPCIPAHCRTSEKGKGWAMAFLKKLVVFALATDAAVALILWSLAAFGFRSPTFALLLKGLIHQQCGVIELSERWTSS